MKKFISLCALGLLSGCANAKNVETAPVPQATTTPGKAMTKTIKQDNGLIIDITHENPTGKKPSVGKKVKVHYAGRLENGKEFDSSYKRGEPFEFVLGAGYVIKGWDQGIAALKVGEKATLTIPSELGYGARGAGGIIPGNATLIFDVELVSAE